ncbi:MAG: class I SAM-dependent methyltransferase [Caulobacteraceae bacterium]|nr:class I SAM-dependent methyltransferase [Caulobacteraceae bacterium]
MEFLMFEWAVQLSDDQWADALSGGGDKVPPMPSTDIQAMFVGSSGRAAFSEPGIFWTRIKEVMAAQGRPLNKDTRVLDLGVGWGRIYRWMLRDLPASNLTGIDIDPKTIAMCSEMMPYGDFRHVPAGAPYPTGYDLATAYSVFSHVNDEVAYAILAEFHRALNPGGFVAVTTLVPDHVNVWASQVDEEPFKTFLANAKFDKAEWLDRVAKGGHLYVPTGGGDPARPSETYGEAVAPEGWWTTVEGFKLVEYSQPLWLPQALVILQKI